jgi:hypothetical protein
LWIFIAIAPRVTSAELIPAHSTEQLLPGCVSA